MTRSSSSGNRVAVYARVSSTDQHPDAQLIALREYVSARGLKVVREYTDHGVSGRKVRRPALDELVRDAERRRFDAVVVVRLDRLARSVQHLTSLVGRWCELGVGLIATDQAIDTSSAAGRFVVHTLAAVAELEAELIRERTIAGLAAARRRGSVLGRRPVLDRAGKDRVRQLRSAGKSLREIAELVGVSVGTVHAVAKA